MSTCRSCGQVIDWVKTTKGKMMPVDPEYYHYNDLKPGDIIITDGGNTHTKREGCSFTNLKGRISHFSSCKDADKWRKK